MELGRIEFTQPLGIGTDGKNGVLLRTNLPTPLDPPELLRRLQVAEAAIAKLAERLDHVEPTVEGLDQTVQHICREGGFDDYGDR